MTISATSQGLKPGVVLSTNRPANPFDGMMIYETDTDKVLVWNGSAWVYAATASASPAVTTEPGLVLITSQTITTPASAFNFTSVFSSTYDNYKVELINFKASASENFFFRLRSGSTDASGGNYYSQRTESQGSTVTGINVGGGGNNAGFPCYIVTGTNAFIEGTFDIRSPYASRYTTATGQFARIDGSTTAYQVSSTVMHNVASSYDGFSFVGNGQNLSGTVRVYGYRNS